MEPTLAAVAQSARWRHSGVDSVSIRAGRCRVRRVHVFFLRLAGALPLLHREDLRGEGVWPVVLAGGRRCAQAAVRVVRAGRRHCERGRVHPGEYCARRRLRRLFSPAAAPPSSYARNRQRVPWIWHLSARLKQHLVIAATFLQVMNGAKFRRN